MGTRLPYSESKSSNVVVGYAANANGFGVAYVSTQCGQQSSLLRVPFRVSCRRVPLDREAGYAAVTAVTRTLAVKGIDPVVVHIEDDCLIEEMHGHREVPASLCLSYVRLGCALNGLMGCRLEQVAAGQAADLTARARAEVHLTVAA
ncbi:MAG: hypothetical protein M3160_02795 [Candidatus Eremiobacteraeota bacterium]|nr:hypothetical protein [Candidatus Eremiobacteraeota bacterium]